MGLNPLESGRVVKLNLFHKQLFKILCLNPLKSGRVVK